MKQKKKIRIPLLLFGILMVVTVGLCAAAGILWYSGRQSMSEEVVAPVLPPVLPQPEEAPEEQPEEEAQEPEDEDKPPVELDAYTIEHEGKYYRYNTSIRNILLLGIDADSKPSTPLTPGGSVIQADVIVLAVLDMDKDQLTLISLNRDTMCNFELMDENGESAGFANAQLALSFSYGDGLERSCELTRDAVSGIFYGLQIHGYGAFYMGGVSALNDALGGITVTIPDDPDFVSRNPYYWQAGQQVTLTGKQAQLFIRYRPETTEGNLLRMQRQKTFMLAAVNQVMANAKEDPLSVLDVYDALKGYITTDLNLARLSYLGTSAATMRFSGDIRNLTGEVVLGDQSHMEMTLDQEALYDLMLDVFYDEVEVG